MALAKDIGANPNDNRDQLYDVLLTICAGHN